MLKKHLLIFLFLICNTTHIFGQQKTGQVAIDSLIAVLPSIKIDTVRVNTLNLIAYEFRNVDTNQGIVYGNKALALSEKINWDDGVAASLILIGENTVIKGDNDTAEKYYNQAAPFAKSKLNKCKLYMALGGLNFEKANHSKAFELLFKALKISEEIKAQRETARLYSVIGVAYINLVDYKNALFYLNKSLDINTKLKRKPQICKNFQYIASIHKSEKKYPLALEYFSKAEKLCKEINSREGLAFINIEKAEIYMNQGKLEKALEHLNLGEPIAIEINNQRYINGCKLSKVEIYIALFSKDSLNPEKKLLLHKAEPLLMDVIKNYKKTDDNYNLIASYGVLCNLYSLQKKHKKAYDASLEIITLKDSVYNETSKETIKNIEDKRTIDLKNKQIQINKITLESKEKQKWFYILGIGFLGILGGLLFYQSSNRKKTNEKLQLLNAELDQANKTKVKFLSILNHDLRSPVYNFIHFMQLQKESPELLDPQTKKTIETKTIASAENLLVSMEDLLLWSKGQMDNFKPQPKTIFVNSLFEDTQKHFESEEKVQFIFENANNIALNTDDNFLKTIIRNLTGNAIKALKSNSSPEITATIAWKAWQENNKTYLSITDNGSGASQEQFKALYNENEVVGIKTGLGLHLIRDLAKAINCEITVTSNNIIGTTFTLQIT
jgi:signal transduction histidine kinase/cbb3-type cytochrome oxidase subunit 3